jgi:hypothetical protein
MPQLMSARLAAWTASTCHQYQVVKLFSSSVIMLQQCSIEFHNSSACMFRSEEEKKYQDAFTTMHQLSMMLLVWLYDWPIAS